MKLYIPNKLKVGFQERSETYTGKLAYIIYYDHKGQLRKEKSWQNWCWLPGHIETAYNTKTKKYESFECGTEPIEIDNVPTEGFVLNKKAGGYRSDWNTRQTYSRVYDPRGFEFEITIDNLLFILAECNCSKGKGIEGELIYAWDKDRLVLLPVSSETYKDSTSFTSLQKKSLSIKDLKEGFIYKTRDEKVFTYIGRHPYMCKWKRVDDRDVHKSQKKHIVYMNDTFSVIPNNIAEECGEDSEYANLVTKYYTTAKSKLFDKITCEDEDPEITWEKNRFWTDDGIRNIIREEYNHWYIRNNVTKYEYYKEVSLGEKIKPLYSYYTGDVNIINKTLLKSYNPKVVTVHFTDGTTMDADEYLQQAWRN